MEQAAGVIVYRTRPPQGKELLVGTCRQGPYAGKKTFCYVTKLKPQENLIEAAVRAGHKETGGNLRLGSPQLLHVRGFGPKVEPCKLDRTLAGKVVGTTPIKNGEVIDLGTKTIIFMCHHQAGEAENTEDVHEFKWMTFGEIVSSHTEFAYDQGGTILPPLQWFLDYRA